MEFGDSLLSAWLARLADKDGLSLLKLLDVDQDTVMDSWVRVGVRSGTGSVQGARWQAFVPVESSEYCLLRKQDGEITDGTCLREDEWMMGS